MLAAKSERMQSIEELRERERQYQLKVIRKEKKKAHNLRHDRIWVSGVVMLCFCMAICFTALEAKIASCDYQINNLKGQINSVENQRDRLALEIEDLKSLSRVEEYAIANLGMIYPDSNDITYMDFSGISYADNSSVAGVSDDTAEGDGNINNASITTREDAAVHPLLLSLNKLLSRYISGGEVLAANS